MRPQSQRLNGMVDSASVNATNPRSCRLHDRICCSWTQSRGCKAYTYARQLSQRAINAEVRACVWAGLEPSGISMWLFLGLVVGVSFGQSGSFPAVVSGHRIIKVNGISALSKLTAELPLHATMPHSRAACEILRHCTVPM